MKDIFYTVIGLIFLLWLGVWLWNSGIIWIILIGLIIFAVVHFRKQHKTNKPSAIKSKSKEIIPVKVHKTQSIESHVSSESDSNLIRIQNHTFLINPDIFELLYFSDGPLQNIDPNAEEPSAISFNLPIDINDNFEELGYYPSYQQCSASQRYNYLCWLCTDLSSVPDIGFAFILLDCLERHIVNNEQIDKCVDLILKLQSILKNKSFSYYSTTSIAYAAFQFKRTDLISKINLENCSPQLQVLFKNQLSTNDLINFAKLVHFTNNRYIKRYPDLFKKALSADLSKKYGEPYFKYKFKDISKLSKSPLMFSNMSLNEPMLLNGKIFALPDPFSSVDFCADIYKELQKAHNLVKDFLKIKRAADPTFSKEEKNKYQSKSKKRINPDTGYPMSTDKQIKSAKDNIDMTKDSIDYHRRQLNDPEYLKFLPKKTSAQKIRDKVYYDFLLKKAKAMYLYKCGKWDDAEKEWLESLFSGLDAANRLRIMYQKENRFKDAVKVMEIAWNSPLVQLMEGDYPELTTAFQKQLKTAKNKADKKTDIDRSKLKDKDFDLLQQNSDELSNKYLNNNN